MRRELPDKKNLNFRQQGQKPQVSLTLSPAILNLNEPGEESIPKDHRLDVSTVTQQTLGVFSHVIRRYSRYNSETKTIKNELIF